MRSIQLLPDCNDDLEVLCLGAHCDDIEIGCGGTLIELVEKYPRVKIRWIVFSSNEVRGAEARESAKRFVRPDLEIELCQFRNGYFPYVGAAMKDHFERLKSLTSPDLIFTHWLSDRHQDHRTIAELTWNTFRSHLILEYEIPKYEGDLGHPNLFVPLAESSARRKVSILREAFRSQHEKKWFTDETFLALMRLRGVESDAASGYAEAFHARKTVAAIA